MKEASTCSSVLVANLIRDIKEAMPLDMGSAHSVGLGPLLINQDHKLPHLQGHVDSTNESTRLMETVAERKMCTHI